MDLRSLRYFQVVAECGSLSRGADMLRISQPAVSRAIRLLEEELGQELFLRHGHGVSLTEAGETLLAHVRRILHQVADARREVETIGHGPGGALRIALPPAVGAVIAPLLRRRMARDLPSVQLEFIGGYSGYIHEWLMRDQVDIACLHDPQPQRGFQLRPLMREEVFLVGRRDLLPDVASAAISDLAQLALILPSGANASRRVLTAWSASEDLWTRPVLTVDDHMILRALLRDGAGASLLTRSAFEEDQRAGLLHAIPLAPAVFWTLCLVSSTRTPISDIALHCIEALTAVIDDLAERGHWLPPLPRTSK